jgi:hypothetical protein
LGKEITTIKGKIEIDNNQFHMRDECGELFRETIRFTGFQEEKEKISLLGSKLAEEKVNHYSLIEDIGKQIKGKIGNLSLETIPIIYASSRLNHSDTESLWGEVSMNPCITEREVFQNSGVNLENHFTISTF